MADGLWTLQQVFEGLANDTEGHESKVIHGC